MDKPARCWFHNTVSALAYSLAQPHAQAPELGPPYNDLTRFILQQHARMPDYLRAPMQAATLGFDLFGMGHGLKRFHHQAPETRAGQVAAWKQSSLSFKRDLVRYFESLATLALYSRAASQRAPEPAQVNAERILAAPPAELRAQFVVVGSGPGGAITACLLAEAGRDVLLVEEGPYFGLDSCEPFSKDEMLQKYRNGGQTVALGKNKIAYVEGRCVGGGSEINSGLYHRTPPEMLERWRKEFQVEALTEKDLIPHFEAVERDVSVSLLPGPAPLASLKLHEGAQCLGWNSLEVPRWFHFEHPKRGSTQGMRQSMTQTFIPRFLKAGGRLLPRTRVNRLHLAIGDWHLEAEHEKAGRVRILAETLFIAGGAVQSPALLRRSGITRNVGHALQVHPTVKMVARFPDTVNAADMGVPVHQVKEFAPRLSFGCSISTPAYLALALIDHPDRAREVHEAWPHLANYYAMITSEGRGSVRTIPRFRDPVVRYSLTQTDRRNLADGFNKLAQILMEAGADALYPGMSNPPELLCRGCLNKLPEVLADGVASLMTIHLFSSCPMGENREVCAADSFGRVNDFKNLYLADGSLLCTAPGVNPQGSIMAVARRNALHSLGKA